MMNLIIIFDDESDSFFLMMNLVVFAEGKLNDVSQKYTAVTENVTVYSRVQGVGTHSCIEWKCNYICAKIFVQPPCWGDASYDAS